MSNYPRAKNYEGVSKSFKAKHTSCFIIPPNQDHVTIRPQVVSQLPIFRGTKNENSYFHIKEFVSIF